MKHVHGRIAWTQEPPATTTYPLIDLADSFKPLDFTTCKPTDHWFCVTSMKEMPWSLLFGFVLAAMIITALGQSYDEASYMPAEEKEEDAVHSLYEAASKRALLALSRFKPFASAFTRSPSLYPDSHRYAARSFMTAIDPNSLTVADRRGRPQLNPMRFGR
ncbi:Hypothetical protein NTJ_06520 [Nesidiocoris tenuis]|uniref:Uncharacterized protein n=1 Tax=Nesidiocoris tenuis TaxID=355587 RepID=A0ABN7ANB0_9HEMI|nr:Hypothetical protein NTJ_06520 [Nesidiocoris tenuis]